MKVRTATHNDLPDILRWRNENRHCFFTQHEVTPQEHREWFERRQSIPGDYMFMVTGSDNIGCIGLRMMKEGWEIYNIMRGSEKKVMSEALQVVIRFARAIKPAVIYAIVLLDNLKAKRFFEKNGFVVVSELDHFVMEYR